MYPKDVLGSLLCETSATLLYSQQIKHKFFPANLKCLKHSREKVV